jgi:hypothetical protein
MTQDQTDPQQPASGALPIIADEPAVEEEWPVIGATGARFGSAGRRKAIKKRRNTHVLPDNYPATGQTGVNARVITTADLTADLAGGPRTRHTTEKPPEKRFAGKRDDAPHGAGKTAMVRPFVQTGGRTESTLELEYETLVSPALTLATKTQQREEYRSVMSLCDRQRSVAEIASLMHMPIGVVRVLVGDLAAAGSLIVHKAAGAAGPDRDLLLRVLAGVRAI